MPVLAMDFKMKQKYCHFAYYGMGPEENYIDRRKGARLGYFDLCTSAPQESSPPTPICFAINLTQV